MIVVKNKVVSFEYFKISEIKVCDIYFLRLVVIFFDYDGVGVVVGDVWVFMI